MTEFQTVARTSEIPPNKSLAVEVDGVSLLVVNSSGEFLSVENRCSHQDKPLEKGRIRGGYIFCPFHGMRFKLSDGQAIGQLTRVPLYVFTTRVVGDEVQVRIDQKPERPPQSVY